MSKLVREMARHVERPAIFPFSNPTENCEAHPEDVLRWTDGRALVATGSPFPPVTLSDRVVAVGQGNNALIFPAIGLGALVAEASEITPGMFRAAARELAACVSEEELAAERLYPAIARLREVTHRVAVAVVRQAIDEGVAREPADAATIPDVVRAAMWEPVYPELIPA